MKYAYPIYLLYQFKLCLRNKRGYKRYSNSNIGAAARKIYESNVKKNNHTLIPIFSKSTFLRIHTPLIEKTYLTKNISNYI
jgi:hypothetical protein